MFHHLFKLLINSKDRHFLLLNNRELLNIKGGTLTEFIYLFVQLFSLVVFFFFHVLTQANRYSNYVDVCSLSIHKSAQFVK